MQRFGKYEILEKIGEGGFGVIYKGFDPLIKRTVAIKTCTSVDEEIRDRFYQEAEIAGNLQHRNITIVFDFGIEDNTPYLVQEYLSGEDLDRKIRRHEALSFGTQLLYLIQVARGLAYAHSRGIIHRDIKPGNIRVLEDDTVKIMDFGIAKLAEAGRTALTQTGQTIGTAAYLAPEQIRGEKIDQRADIFAFGLLTYELLTGRRAFSGDNPSSVIYQVLTENPPQIRDFLPDCPKEMIDIVGRCLMKAPDERYGDCSELLADLDHLVDFRHDQAEVRPVPRASPPSAPQPGAPQPGAPQPGASTQAAGPADQEGGRAAPTAPKPPQETLVAAPQETLIVAPQETLRASGGETVRSPAASPHSTLEVSGHAAGIDHVRLHSERHRARSTPLRTAGATQNRRTGHMLGYITLFLLAGSLGAGAWWFWEVHLPAQEAAIQAVVEPGGAGSSGPNPAPAQLPEPSPSSPEPDPSTTASGPPEGGGEAISSQPSNSQAAATDSPEAAAVAVETPPPPPPEPPRGILVFPRAWDPGMTVSINGGRAMVLDRERRVRLPPGAYRLSFDLVSRNYANTAESTVQLRAGGRQEVRIPIPLPARIQVRQLPGSPRGWVLADGKPLGWSPIQEHQLAPGKYELTITRGPGEGAPVAIRQAVTLHANRVLIVTFDLRRTGPPTMVERPVSG